MAYNHWHPGLVLTGSDFYGEKFFFTPHISTSVSCKLLVGWLLHPFPGPEHRRPDPSSWYQQFFLKKRKLVSAKQIKPMYKVRTFWIPPLTGIECRAITGARILVKCSTRTCPISGILWITSESFGLNLIFDSQQPPRQLIVTITTNPAKKKEIVVRHYISSKFWGSEDTFPNSILLFNASTGKGYAIKSYNKSFR